MFTLVIGGNASGKSEYAEQHVLSLSTPEKTSPQSGNRIYIATMQPFGEDARARIARHHAMRRDRGFVTIERYTDLSGLKVPEGSNVLLEDMGNLVANEMFSKKNVADEMLPDKIHSGETHAPSGTVTAVLTGVDHLLLQCAHLTIVTNEVFSDGKTYEKETLHYLRELAAVNRSLAARADRVVEIVCGIPNRLK